MPATMNPPMPDAKSASGAHDGKALVGGSEMRGLTPCQKEIVELFGDAVAGLGLARSYGLIYGSVFVSDEPVSFAEVMERLGISRGSVSIGLRFLRDLGAIRATGSHENRAERYTAETELRRLLAGLLASRVRPPLESGAARVREIQQKLEQTDERDCEFLAKRLATLQVWHKQALFALPLVQRLIRIGQR